MPRNADCSACPLHQRACTVCVWGEGPVPARLMIVGMAPGAQEDLRGRPFVGPSGDILNEALAHAGLDRTQIYITNSVKCFPGKGKPGRQEIGTCTELYLKEEIERVQPQLIVVMGDIAMLAVTNRSGVKANRGRMLELRPGLGGKTPVLVTYHPAAFLHSHDKTIKEAIRADLETAKAILEGKTLTLPVRGGVSADSSAFGDVVAVDVETDKEGNLVVGTLSTERGDYLRFGREGVLHVFETLKAQRLIAWNAPFDREVLDRCGVDTSRFDWADPMFMLHLLDSSRQGRYSLEAAVLDEFGWADKEWLDSKRRVHGGEDVPLEELTRYCAQDSTYTFKLYLRFKERLLQRPKLAKLYKHHVMPAVWMLQETERHVVPLDMAYLRELDEKFTTETKRLARELAEIAGLDEVPNFRSNKVLAEVMYQRLGLPIVAVTDKGAPATHKLALMELMHLSPFVARLIRYRKFGKLHGTYVQRWLHNYADQPFQASYNVLGTKSGRLSSDFQQVPRVDEDPDIPNMRDAIRAPDGYVVLEADYSMEELRLIAWWAQEENLLAAIASGDVHAHTASQAFGPNITKFMRQVGKTENFLLGYGGSHYKLAETLRLKMKDEQIKELCGILHVNTLMEASKILHRRWHESYPGIRQWHWKERTRIEATGMAVAPHGRVRLLPTAKSKDQSIRDEAAREGINHVIQSLASDLTLMAGRLASWHLFQKSDLLHIRGPWPTHDSLMWIVPEKFVNFAAEQIRRAMEVDAPRLFRELLDVDITVPLPADIKVGPRWGSVKELARLEAA